ncbi:MAG: hypothetical protein U9Q07_03515, partial [Planctomycetota bacterium]|nr:hypothetical protein [Planctomycetota bacterium]
RKLGLFFIIVLRQAGVLPFAPPCHSALDAESRILGFVLPASSFQLPAEGWRLALFFEQE